jgi:DNA-directed RNA polymerase specialized sigma24 family protein
MEKSSFEIAATDLLLARARKGEAKAIEEIYRTFCGPVYTLSLRICASSDKAEYVVQDTFIEAFSKLDQYRGEEAAHTNRRCDFAD